MLILRHDKPISYDIFQVTVIKGIIYINAIILYYRPGVVILFYPHPAMIYNVISFLYKVKRNKRQVTD